LQKFLSSMSLCWSRTKSSESLGWPNRLLLLCRSLKWLCYPKLWSCCNLVVLVPNLECWLMLVNIGGTSSLLGSMVCCDISSSNLDYYSFFWYYIWRQWHILMVLFKHIKLITILDKSLEDVFVMIFLGCHGDDIWV
jgi:hypothetical protein